MITLSFTPRRDGMPAAETCKMDVLLRISPEATGEVRHARPPLNIALVIDKSGSMAGRPLHEAKRCAEMVVDRLASIDRLAIVAYDNQVDVLVKSTPVGDRTLFKRALAEISEGGTTNLHGGWEVGATEVAGSLRPGQIARVLLLSDGQANNGLTDPGVIAGHCAELAAADVTTSTYGLGEGFNEDLMTKMARSGQGQAHYGRAAEDLIDPFQQEFDLLRALVARRLRLSLEAMDGVKVEVLNLFSLDAETGTHVLPDLAEGGELWALLRLDIDARLSMGREGSIKILTAKLTYKDREDRHRQSEPATLYLKPLSATSFAELPEDPTVRDRSLELEVARLAEEAREAARQGAWNVVENITQVMTETASSNEWAQESVASLRKLATQRNREGFSKEALYKAGRIRSRMASLDENGAAWSEARESQKPSYLRRKGEEGRRFPTNAQPPSDVSRQKPENPGS